MYLCRRFVAVSRRPEDMFEISDTPIDGDALRRKLSAPSHGGFVSFEGVVRNHHQDRSVTGLRYSDYRALALKEGGRILEEAREKWPDTQAVCVHRVGMLDIGGMAVWVGASSAHRDEAFAACRYVIDEVKSRVPIWKEEFYADGTNEWVVCGESHGGCDSGHH